MEIWLEPHIKTDNHWFKSFFHLVSAVDILAQFINKKRVLGLRYDKVSVRRVLQNLGVSDPIRTWLTELHPYTRGKPLPLNPYSDEGFHFRMLVFRHWVNHWGENPFCIRVGDETQPHISLFLDPRNPSLGGSKFPAIEELEKFWGLVNDKCKLIIENL